MAFCDSHVKWIGRTNRGLTAPAANDLNGTWWQPNSTSP